MAVTVKFFASVREAVGTGTVTLDLPAGVATVGQLREHLSARGEAWHAALASPSLRMACQQVMCDAATPVVDGMEVAFFPPVTGG
ncbi:molybdopterin synthase sulfur carrier subunit [Duganella sp. Leaf126]|uniref:molybdopterin converting factor subunit 1 n=1 Tax=Duganella sp. Leaf126 TaxID=1736266 RepID=UPI0006FBB810|nr:molybdopterin converting factor subunit 1 [Duganella sp. Leaf126]KQQ32405.1 molybdopterin synthase sulfur carrier subunit [Duganella sp. Leaf126]